MQTDSFSKSHFPCCVLLETILRFRIKSKESTSSTLWLWTSLSSPQNHMVPQTDVSQEPSIGDLVLQECRSPQETAPPRCQPPDSHWSLVPTSLSAVCVPYDVWVSVSSVSRSLVISIKVKSFLRLPVSAALIYFYSPLSFISLRTISFIWHVSCFGACVNQMQRSHF